MIPTSFPIDFASKRMTSAVRTTGVSGLVAVGVAIMIAGSAHWCTPSASAQTSPPALSGRVVDEAGVLSSTARSDLSTLLEDHERETGNQLAVLTVRTLGGVPVEEYALDVARDWQLGTSENDNGVLFLLAIDDREMRIEVGYGLEGVLPDVTASRILRNEVRPFLRQGDYDGGVRAGVIAILSAIDGAYEPSEVSAESPPFGLGIMFLVIPSIFAFLGILSSGCARWFLFLFLMPFFLVAGFALTGSPTGGLIFLGLYILAYVVIQSHPKVKKLRETMKKEGSVRFGPMVIGGGSGRSGGSFGGFSGGGGGFSGGGGSFGGGGASGGW